MKETAQKSEGLDSGSGSTPHQGAAPGESHPLRQG